MFQFIQIATSIGLLLLLPVAAVIPDKLTSGCKQKLFPVSFGGSGDEHVNCVIDDKVNK